MNEIVSYTTMKYTTTAITAVSKTAVVTLKIVLLSSRRWFQYGNQSQSPWRIFQYGQS
jgi:hypothetical protein